MYTSRLLLRVIAISLFAVGCGYLEAGEWENDPKNWHRALDSDPPPGVVVLHSLFWRAPHWSWEGGYFFEITSDELYRQQLFAPGNLLMVTDEMGEAPSTPSWFAPKPPSAYDVWADTTRPGNFRVLVDKRTGHIYIRDYQT